MLMSNSVSASVTPQQRRLLDAIVMAVPVNLDMLFAMYALPEDERGACSTYSRILAEVLREFGIRAEVRPVYVETINQVAREFRAGKISEEEAVRRGGKIQVWGDINRGQKYQHAICYIPDWDVIIDLAMERRFSGLVPSHPYWAENRKFPSWIALFQFKSYPLEYRGYEEAPEKVEKAKEVVRNLVRRYK